MIQLELLRPESKLIFVRVNSNCEFVVRVDSKETVFDAYKLANEIQVWLKDYTRFTLFLEDLVIVSPDRPGDVTLFDTVNATMREAHWNPEQLAATLILALCGEEVPTEALYAIAEPLFEGWPNELRPIP